MTPSSAVEFLAWLLIAAAIIAMLAKRLRIPYTVSPVFTEKIPFYWQHMAVRGGLRGALALDLALSLNSAFPYREHILNLTFGVLIFHPGAESHDQASSKNP
jgi:CPA1 family monovalent cation:H+ antiporter